MLDMTRVDFLFERATFLSKKPARRIGSKVKSQLSEINLEQIGKKHHFLRQKYDHYPGGGWRGGTL